MPGGFRPSQDDSQHADSRHHSGASGGRDHRQRQRRHGAMSRTMIAVRRRLMVMVPSGTDGVELAQAIVSPPSPSDDA